MNHSIDEIWGLIELRRYDLARVKVNDAIASEPNNTIYLHAAAQIEFEQEDFQNCLRICRNALATSPNSQELLLLSFYSLVELNQQAEAEETIIGLIRLNPGNATYLASYSSLMLETMHLNKAKALCNEALRIDPENKRATITSMLLNICDGNLRNSDLELAKLVAEDPKSEYVLALIADSLLEKRRYTEAQNVLQELVKLRPNDEDYIKSLVEVRSITHWSSAPNSIFNRLGWAGSIALWALFILILRLSGSSVLPINQPTMNIIVYGYLSLVIYSWLQPPLLKKWLYRFGI